jgi:predicted transcriptional regulator
MKRPILHRNEKEIIRVLYRECIPISIHDISIHSGISWVTVNKYIDFLVKKSIISRIKDNKKYKFTLNRDLLECLYEYQKKERGVINADYE